MRISPWIGSLVRSGKPGSSAASTDLGIARVKAVHPTYAVLSDTQREIYALFSDDVRELVRLTLHSDLSALENRYVHILAAEHAFAVVNCERHEALMVDQIVVLDPDKPAVSHSVPLGSAEANESAPQAENITFKSDAMKLIKTVVTNLSSCDKRSERADALLRDMKSRMGTALTAAVPVTPLKSEPTLENNGLETSDTETSQAASPAKNSAAMKLQGAKTSAETRECAPGKRLRSSAQASKTSLRSGKSYSNGESDEAQSSPSPKKARPTVLPTPEAETVAAASSEEPLLEVGLTCVARAKNASRGRGLLGRDSSPRSPLWNISPPLLEGMRNLVHKHFSKWT